MRRPAFVLGPAAGALGPADQLSGLTPAGWPPLAVCCSAAQASQWSRGIRGTAPNLGRNSVRDLVLVCQLSGSQASFFSLLMPVLPNPTGLGNANAPTHVLLPPWGYNGTAQAVLLRV